LKTQKTILFAILNWGLGHATRCIPIIDKLLKRGHQVVLASDGLALELLKREFANLPFVELPAYNIRYPQKGSMFMAMLWQTPRLLKTIEQSHQFVTKIVEEYNVDCIISDNRYGCFCKDVHSIFLTHQVNIPLPKGFGFFKTMVDKQNFSYINQYSELWIPDVEGHVVSGALSFKNERCVIKSRFVGLLSRMKWKAVERADFVLVVLSGPEPQRSIFEQKIMNQSKFYDGEVVLVRGSQANSKFNVPKPDNLTLIDLADSTALNDLLLKARYIICRSGYSSIMDLLALQRTAFIVPTPGQTEQELLAKRLSEQLLFVSCPQSLFNLNKATKALKNFEVTANIDLKDESEWLFNKALVSLEV